MSVFVLLGCGPTNTHKTQYTVTIQQTTSVTVESPCTPWTSAKHANMAAATHVAPVGTQRANMSPPLPR